MEGEKFSWKKLFDLSPLAFWKVAGIGLKVGIIASIIFGLLLVYNIFKPKQVINKIEAKKGGTVIVMQDGKLWEAGINIGAIRLGDENGAYAGVELKRKF